MIRAMFALLALSACSKSTEFPPGVEPLEPLAVDAHDPSEEGFNMLMGDDGYLWAHLHGHVHADIATVWAAYKAPPVVVDRRRVSRYDTAMDVEAGYDFSMAIDQTVQDIVTVDYTLTWRHVQLGNKLSDGVAMRWQKTDGTGLIDRLEGSVVLTAVDDNVTEIAMMEHLKAPATKEEDVASLLRDMFADVASHAKGEALQEF